MSSQRERTEFVAVMSREFAHLPPLDLARLLGRLMRLAKMHNKLMEDACNAGEDEEAVELCERGIRQVCEKIGCGAVLSGDPRGATVKLKVPSGRTDDWGGTGLCVPQ